MDAVYTFGKLEICHPLSFTISDEAGRVIRKRDVFVLFFLIGHA